MIDQHLRLLLLLEKNKLVRFKKIFRQKEWPKIFVFSSFLLIALFMAALSYLFARSTFSFLKTSPEFLPSMVFHLLLTWFFLIFLLTLGSSIISAINSLFLQEDDDLLLSFPLDHQLIFALRLINLLFLNAWPVVIFGPPLLLALYQTLNLSFFHFLLSTLLLLLILFVSTLAASILSLLITSLTGRFGQKLVNLSALLGLPIVSWLAAQVLLPQDFFHSFENLKLVQIDQYLKSLPLNSPFLPSTWVVNFILYLPTQPQWAFLNLGKILLLFLALALLLWWLVKKEYYQNLDRARIGHFIAGPHDIHQPPFKQKSFPYLLKNLQGAFFEKDLLQFFRHQAELFQSGFIFFIIILYFIILSRIPLDQIKTSPHFSFNDLLKTNFLFIAYVLDVFALRFIFPGFSLEGQSAWLLWSAPLKKEKLFQQKLLTGWLCLTILGGISSFLTYLILKLTCQDLLHHLFAFTLLSLSLVSINLSLGALFPNFTEKNAEKISTSGGGIFATAASLVYIFAATFLLFSPHPRQQILSLVFFLILSYGLFATLYSLTVPKLEKYEF